MLNKIDINSLSIVVDAAERELDTLRSLNDSEAEISKLSDAIAKISDYLPTLIAPKYEVINHRTKNKFVTTDRGFILSFDMEKEAIYYRDKYIKGPARIVDYEHKYAILIILDEDELRD